MLFRSSFRSALSRVIRLHPTLEPLEDRTLLTFGLPIHYAIGSNPRSLAAVDLNGDGQMDLVTANTDGSSASVLLNNGDGTFQSAVSYPASRNPWAVAVGDLNGDAVPDVVTASAGSTGVGVLLGNGDGTLQAVRNVAAALPSHDVKIGDLNSDGRPDLVAANYLDGRATVLLGTGDGSFEAPVQYATGSGARAAAIGDYDGDDVSDLAVANANTPTVSVLMGNGDGSFRPAVNLNTGPDSLWVATADLNGDGLLELVAANGVASTLSVLLGNGNGSFQSRVSYPTANSPWFVTAADLDLDGTPDLISAGGSRVSILPGNGDGTFRAADLYDTGGGPSGVAVQDYNNDGLPDLAVANFHSNNVAILLQQSPAATRFRVTASAGTIAGTVLPVTVAALISSGEVATGYRGTVHFTSSDPAASLPADYTYTEADQGSRTFNVTLRTAGSRTVTVTDTAAGFITGSATIIVNPAPASVLVVAGFPSSVIAGDVEAFRVTARDPFGNTATGYRGTVHFTSTDPQATLPRNYTFTANDNGVRYFGAVLKTAATQSLTATDTGTGSITGTQSDIVVNPSVATGFVLLAPATAVAGVPFDLSVIAADAYGNVATGYRGTVTFFSLTDPDAALPGEYTFTAGDAGFVTFFEGAALFTPGMQDLWVIDTSEPIFGITLVEVMAGNAPGGGPGPADWRFPFDSSEWLFDVLLPDASRRKAAVVP